MKLFHISIKPDDFSSAEEHFIVASDKEKAIKTAMDNTKDKSVLDKMKRIDCELICSESQIVKAE